MTPFTEFDRLPGRVSAPFSSCWGADQLAGVTVQASPRAFIPCVCVDDIGGGLSEAAERHERLVRAAQRAPQGNKLRLQQMARVACLERLRAELDAI